MKWRERNLRLVGGLGRAFLAALTLVLKEKGYRCWWVVGCRLLGLLLKFLELALEFLQRQNENECQSRMFNISNMRVCSPRRICDPVKVSRSAGFWTSMEQGATHFMETLLAGGGYEHSTFA